MKFSFNLIFFLLLTMSYSASGQALDEEVAFLDNNFLMNDGVYLSFDEFRSNSPNKAYLIKRHEDSIQFFTINGDSINRNIWGYCINGRPYVYYNGEFNRIISLGKLCHFTNTELMEFTTVDAFGFPVTRREYRVNQLFFDVEKEQIDFRYLNRSNMEDVLEEINLGHSFKKELKSEKGLISILQTINRSIPIYITNE